MAFVRLMMCFILSVVVSGFPQAWQKSVPRGGDSGNDFHHAVLRSLSGVHQALIRATSDMENYTMASEEDHNMPEDNTTIPEGTISAEYSSYCFEVFHCPTVDASTLIPSGSLQTGFNFTYDQLEKACRYYSELIVCSLAGNYSRCGHLNSVINLSRNISDYACYAPGFYDVVGALECVNNQQLQFDTYRHMLELQGAYETVMRWPNASKSVRHMMTCRALDQFYGSVRGTLETRCMADQVRPLLTLLKHYISAEGTFKLCLEESAERFNHI